MSKRSILKLALSGAYCGETYYDFLDEEEIEGIFNAMEVYAESVSKPELPQPTGVTVWVSWDEHTRMEKYPVLSFVEPFIVEKGGYRRYYEVNDDGYFSSILPENAKQLNLQTGQCKKFRITEVESE